MNAVQGHTIKMKTQHLVFGSRASCLLRNSTGQGEFTMNTFGVGVNEVE